MDATVTAVKQAIEGLSERNAASGAEEWTLAGPVEAKSQWVTSTSAYQSTVDARFRNGYRLFVPLFPFPSRSIWRTNMCKQMVSADGRFRALYYWLRSLLSTMGLICPDDSRLLTSYVVSRLCMRFLSSRKLRPPVLPNLLDTHPELVGKHWPLWRVEALLRAEHVPYLEGWESRNRTSVGELAVMLAHYYSVHRPTFLVFPASNGHL
jgi:hypothetical protein